MVKNFKKGFIYEWKQVTRGTDLYVDEIIVNEQVDDCKTVIDLLKKYGLV